LTGVVVQELQGGEEIRGSQHLY